MSKRYIGIDLEGFDVRVAVLTASAGKIDVQFDRREYNDPETAAEVIREFLGGKASMGDRLVTALPCRVGLFRRLHFPFREKNKIEAALALELNSQLPVSLESHVLSSLPPSAREHDYEVDAVAINRLDIQDLLAHFPEPEQHPRRIDLYPFALLPALAHQDGVLIYCRRLEVVVALIYEGMIWDYRLLPGTAELGSNEIFDFIASQVSQLENAFGQEDLPLWVIGAGVTDDLMQQFIDTDRDILSPAEDVFGSELPPDMAPAAMLALAELRSAKKKDLFNFRKGEFAARGQLEVFRTRLVVAAVLLLIVLAGGALSMHLAFLQKNKEEKLLKEQMTSVFKQVMPAGTTIVDVPLQMESHLKDLQTQVQLFGLGGQGAAQVLYSLSKNIDDNLRVDLQEFNYSSSEVVLSGNADSFEIVNQITEKLGSLPLFAKVEMTDAKLSTDNTQVDFQLKLTIGAKGE